MNKFEQQAKSFGAEFAYEEVSSIQEDKIRQFTVKSSATASTPILYFRVSLKSIVCIWSAIAASSGCCDLTSFLN